MRTGFGRLSSTLLGWCASLWCAAMVQGQTSHATWYVYFSAVTTNNITEAKYVWTVPACQSLVSTGPLTHYGNTFWYDFEITGPVLCPYHLIYEESTNVTLGTLDPGVYTMITTSWGVPVATNIFTVPTLVLQPVGFAGNGSFQIQLLNGITNANYVLQCSTNFADWTSLSTNSLVPLLTDTNPALPGPRFYRVQVLGP